MCRKLIFFVLVLGLVSNAKAVFDAGDPNDPNLEAWWRFDDVSGPNAVDSSLNGRTGTLYGDPNWVSGRIEGALDFSEDSNDYVDVNNYPGIMGDNPRTVTVWIKTSSEQHFNQIVGWGSAVGGYGGFWDVGRWSVTLNYGKLFIALAGGNSWALGNLANGEWHHIAAVLPDTDPNAATIGDIKLYVDGVPKSGGVGQPQKVLNTHGYDPNDANAFNNVYIGYYAEAEYGYDYFDGIIDDVRIYNRGLDANEVAKVAEWIVMQLARDEFPVNLAKRVSRTVTLHWLAGVDANTHDVYFGTDETAVADANTSSSEYKGNQKLDANSYPTPGPLALSTTYYWRIDEINDVDPNNVLVWTGDVWEFTVDDFIYVDSFEQYVGDPPDDPNLLGTWTKEGGTQLGSYGLWLMDGLGEPNHWGENSMRITYWNDSGFNYYSAGSRAPVDPNWTRNDVKALYLHFMGKVDNPGDKFYVELEDGDANTAKVIYGGAASPDVNAIQLTEWTLWRIDLQDFVTVNPDFDLTNVAKLTIGIGEEGVDPGYAPTAEDYVYIDDIRLVRSRCLAADYPEYGNDADFNDDCMIDFKDLKRMVSDWLASDYTLTTDKPNDANMTGWWKFDDGTGTTAADSSGNGYTGTLISDPNWVLRDVNDANDYVLDFNGVGDYVKIADYNGITGANSRTMTAWVNLPAGQVNTHWNDIISWGTENGGKRWSFTVNYGYLFLGVNGGYNRGPDTLVADGEWHHVAAVLENDGSPTIKEALLYVDGGLQSNSGTSIQAINTDPNNVVQIGFYNAANGDYFKGMIDDVRIYDFALSEAEVAWLAADGAGTLYVPLVRQTVNLYDDDQIDFKDFAIMADIWLEVQEWP